MGIILPGVAALGKRGLTKFQKRILYKLASLRVEATPWRIQPRFPDLAAFQPGETSRAKKLKAIDVTGDFSTSGRDRGSRAGGRWYAKQEVQAGTDRQSAEADRGGGGQR